MSFKLALVAPLLVCFASCNSSEHRIFCLIPSDAETVLQEESEVLLNGIRIGKLEGLNVYSTNPTIVSGYIKLDKGVCVPDSSSFKLCNAGIIANEPYIKVVSSNSRRCISKNDTVLVEKCIVYKKALGDSTTIKLVDSLMHHLKRIYINR